LRLIERIYRERFEFVFKRKYENVEPEETKKSLGDRIRERRKLIEDIEVLEGAFAQTFQPLEKDYEFALAERNNGPNTIVLADIRRSLEAGLKADERHLRKLKRYKKPASSETILVRVVAKFLAQNGFNPVHTLEIARLLICHDTNLWKRDEKLAKEYRACLGKYGRKPRTKRHRRQSSGMTAPRSK